MSISLASSIQLELRSFGKDDSYDFSIARSFIKINGKEEIKTNSRGFTIATITDDGRIGETTRYDTWGNDHDCIRLRDYLAAIPNNTCLAGITFDSYETSILDNPFKTPSSTFDTEVRPMLTKMGIGIHSNNYRCSVCFFVTKGKPELTKQCFASRWNGPATMKCHLR